VGYQLTPTLKFLQFGFVVSSVGYSPTLDNIGIGMGGSIRKGIPLWISFVAALSHPQGANFATGQPV